ncbi:tRNA (adenosine(37)-N6)-threonylcarbamoyltransferase complex dimerization subunit type 1 TsaB, partial [Rhizobium hidalgonense]|nr:tRNA (adenosine(37)-N6)-threonylcarbamoyltransferase complex dimerization subunit type 1 TsaB [Rhizobium hidalgonense]
LVGSGSALVKSDSQLIRHTQVQATSMDVAVLGDAALQAGQTVTAHDALPVYLRENAWKKIAEQGS